jgi:type IV pilus assembly protein PilA
VAPGGPIISNPRSHVFGSDRGFTLIELIVVILIVAILAAIAVPVFLNQRDKGRAAQVQSALRNVVIAIEGYGADNGGYGGLNANPQLADRLREHGFRIPEWAATPGYFRVRANSTQYCVEVRHRLLSSSDPWHEATYQSVVGSPQSTPDLCPS